MTLALSSNARAGMTREATGSLLIEDYYADMSAQSKQVQLTICVRSLTVTLCERLGCDNL